MHTTTSKKIALAIALLATLAMTLVLADGALATPGGNAANAKLCQKDGWTKLMDSTASSFTGEKACVSHAAQGGAIYALATVHVEPCASQPFDGICVSTSASGLQPGSVVTTTLFKNGSSILEDFPIVQGDGTVTTSPISHFEIPCVVGNEYSASATGASAASLTSPTTPGIAISSNTAERTSACP
jgi:hypothetical protein